MVVRVCVWGTSWCGMDGVSSGEGLDIRMNNSFTPQLLQADPALFCLSPPSLCFSSLLSPCVLPFGFSHFIPSPVLFSFLSVSVSLSPSLPLHVSNLSSPSVAQGMFSFQMRTKKSCDKVIWVHVCKCGTSFMDIQPRSARVSFLTS